MVEPFLIRYPGLICSSGRCYLPPVFCADQEGLGIRPCFWNRGSIALGGTEVLALVTGGVVTFRVSSEKKV